MTPVAPSRAGWSLVELLVVVTLLALTVTITVPAAGSLRDTARCQAAARRMAAWFGALRWESVTAGRTRGLAFDRDPAGWYWNVVEDGNGNGLRTAEVAGGVDRVLSGPHRLGDDWAGVGPGIPLGGALPNIPPASGVLGNPADPIRFGASNLVSFSPDGSASSGTVYITDGQRRLYGVRLYGPTARVRVWRYDMESGAWRR